MQFKRQFIHASCILILWFISYSCIAEQQQGGADCELFSIAFAFHVLHCDDVEKQCLDQERM